MYSISRIAVAVAASSMMLTAPVLADEAQEPSFDKVGVSYIELDVLDESASGFGVQLERSFNEKVFASIQHLDASETYTQDVGTADAGVELGVELTHANLGYKFYQSNRTVAYMTAGYTRAKATGEASLSDGSFSESYSESDSGWNAQVGVRSRFTSNFEVDAAVRHIDIAEESDQEFSIAARFYFEPNFSISANYNHVDSDMSYVGVGVNYHF